MTGQFRVWCKERNEWEGHDVVLNPDGGILHWDGLERLHPVKPSTHIVEFFIGLFDKNGKMIFDGDVCKFFIPISDSYPDPGPIPKSLHIIEERNAAWGFCPMFPELVHPDDREWKPFWNQDNKDMWSTDYFEVVGNIHENPELFKL